MRDLAFLLGKDAASLTGGLAPATSAAIGDLVPGMTCYYGNLINGHDTRRLDIERALQAVFALTRNAALQREAVGQDGRGQEQFTAGEMLATEQPMEQAAASGIHVVGA